MNPIQFTEHYFEVSNKSDFEEIRKLLHTNATYSSQNTGLYLGVESIIEMQKVFHGSFEELKWKTLEIQEEKSGIVRVDFDFLGRKKGEDITFSGIEYIVVSEGKIQHIEIRNK